MVHAYDLSYLDSVQRKLGALFSMAAVQEHMDIDGFAEKFISSGMAEKFETANPVYVLGKTENELFGIILGKEPVPNIMEKDPAALWTGCVLAYAQWYLRKSFKDITDKFPCSRLKQYFFSYSEKPVSASLELIKEKISYEYPVRAFRKKRHFTQAELAKFSGLSVSSIKAFETGRADISHARAVTLYRLSKALSCSIDDLIC